MPRRRLRGTSGAPVARDDHFLVEFRCRGTRCAGRPRHLPQPARTRDFPREAPRRQLVALAQAEIVGARELVAKASATGKTPDALRPAPLIAQRCGVEDPRRRSGVIVTSNGSAAGGPADGREGAARALLRGVQGGARRRAFGAHRIGHPGAGLIQDAPQLVFDRRRLADERRRICPRSPRSRARCPPRAR